jgi:hypothetical protein
LSVVTPLASPPHIITAAWSNDDGGPHSGNEVTPEEVTPARDAENLVEEGDQAAFLQTECPLGSYPVFCTSLFKCLLSCDLGVKFVILFLVLSLGISPIMQESTNIVLVNL